MNQAMQSFLLKTICCILIINVTFCSSCLQPICKARCYIKHGGMDFGYCKNGDCKCIPPVIYVFDGINHDLNDKNIYNNNVIQNSIPISNPSASDSSDEIKKNKQKKNGAEKVDSKNNPILNKVPNQPPLQATTASTQASPQIAPSPKIASSPKIAPSPQAEILKKINQKTLSSPRNKVPTPNPNNQQHEILFEISEESFEDTMESSEEKIEQTNLVKSQTSNDEAGKNFAPPVEKEKPDDSANSSSYESLSESYELTEEKNSK